MSRLSAGDLSLIGSAVAFYALLGLFQSVVRELCFTARKFDADEAAGFGMVSKVLPDQARYGPRFERGCETNVHF